MSLQVLGAALLSGVDFLGGVVLLALGAGWRVLDCLPAGTDNRVTDRQTSFYRLD